MAGRADYSDRGSILAPARKAFAVTPADSDLAKSTRAIYVGGAGNLAVILVDDTVAVTFSSVPAGTMLNIQAKQIKSTGTTATNIVGVY